MRRHGCPGGRGPTSNKKCKLSVAEQSAKLHARALALENQGKMDELKTLLKQRPDLLDTTLNHCKKLAVMGMSPGPRHRVQLPAAQHEDDGRVAADASASDQRSTTASSQYGEDDGDNLPGPPQAVVVPRCYTNIGMITPSYIMTFLAGVESISLSKQNLKQLSSRRSRHINKDKLLELVEFLTGLGPDADYHPDLHVMAKWVELAAGYNVSRGRPAKELQLPVTWEADGIFRWYLPSGEDAMAMIVHKITKEERQVTKGFWDVIQNPQALYVDKNYSEKNATLCERDGFGRLPISTIFPELIENDLMRWCAQQAGAPKTEKPLALEADPQSPVQDAAAGEEAAGLSSLSAAGASEVDAMPPPPRPAWVENRRFFRITRWQGAGSASSIQGRPHVFACMCPS